MANPKVFVSSTCYDLKEIRESLLNFIKEFGFDPILSDYGDVFYHPDLHTHEACINEISNCDLFILIIGGRFGGKYISDMEKSIVNAEYEAAKKRKIPIFTYIKQDVFDNHHLYQENKHHQFLDKIHFPAIEKQHTANKIFNFIDQVRKSSKNNACEPFKNFHEIKSHLRKQWAGMFFEFLKSRTLLQEMMIQQTVLEKLTESSSVLEKIVKELYKSNSPHDGKDSLDRIESRSYAEMFIKETFYNVAIKVDSEIIKKILETKTEGLTWDQFLVETGVYDMDLDEQGIFINEKYHNYDDFRTGGFSTVAGKYSFIDNIAKYYDFGYSKLTEQEKEELLVNDIFVGVTYFEAKKKTSKKKKSKQ
ncbi:DUF4062 domain-containing protein [Peredibacter sp. HCB2-198]|uniref:DUF4062 domain-containing protein n=1 Tax=Peredibacter sp. HCB2-198 TaxID=3383025 RepID=UPI0038B4AC89